MGKANLCSFIRSCDIFMSMNCLNIFNTVLVKFDFKLTFFEFISHDILLLLFASSLFVTLHGISGNKVNARTRHVITRSHANGMTRLPCGYAHKNN